MSQQRAVRLTPLVLTVALAALAGCGGSKESATPATTAAPAPGTTTTATTPTSTAPTSTSAPSPSGSGGSSSLSLSASSEGQLAYNTKSLSAKAGKVAIDFTNSAPLSHNVTVESSSGQVLGATPTFSGGSKTVSLDLKPGTYKFFCSVPGHRQAGMEGTLVVK